MSGQALFILCLGISVAYLFSLVVTLSPVSVRVDWRMLEEKASDLSSDGLSSEVPEVALAPEVVGRSRPGGVLCRLFVRRKICCSTDKSLVGARHGHADKMRPT